ncbi:MAG: MATE family efflux transporter [Deltaproteobacteria bacterium]
MSRRNLTEGSIVASLLALAVPIVFANILQTAYQLTDTFWVGRLGAGAVASISICFPAIFLLISLGGGIVIAGSILVAQYTGRNDARAADHIAGQTIVMMVAAAGLISAVGYALTPVFMRLMGAEPTVTQDAVSYMRISLAGLIFLFGFFVFQALMRGVGDVKTPLYIVLGTVLLNLVIDPLFIFGWGPLPAFGVSGAAIATIITQGLSAVLGIFLLFSGRYGIHLRITSLWPDTPLIRRMFRLGIPSSIEQSTRALALTVLTILVTSFGTKTIAAYGIGIRILSFIIIPAVGLSMATSTLIGQNMGAGKLARAESIAHKATLGAFLILTGLGVVFFIFARPLVRVFIPENPVVIDAGVAFVRTMAFSFGMIGVQQVMTGVFRGSGDTVMAMVIAIVSLWVLRFPLAYVLSKHTALGENGIWWAFPVSNVLAAATAGIWFLKGGWKRRNAIEEYGVAKEVTKEAIVEGGFD